MTVAVAFECHNDTHSSHIIARATHCFVFLRPPVVISTLCALLRHRGRAWRTPGCPAIFSDRLFIHKTKTAPSVSVLVDDAEFGSEDTPWRMPPGKRVCRCGPRAFPVRVWSPISTFVAVFPFGKLPLLGVFFYVIAWNVRTLARFHVGRDFIAVTRIGRWLVFRERSVRCISATLVGNLFTLSYQCL